MDNIWMLFPGGRTKTLTLSYDDGVEQDIRLMEIMDRHGLKGTFNLNAGLFAQEGHVYPKGQVHRRLSKSAALALYGPSGHEVALHAYYHGDLKTLPAANAAWQVMKDREELEDMFGRIIPGMAYPYGTWSEEVVRMLRGCGVKYSRTTSASLSFNLPDPESWLKLSPTCHHRVPELMEMGNAFLKPAATQLPRMFYLWGHSYEFEQNDNWHVIEDFAALMGGHEDIWYATNLEIYDYIDAWRQLRTSLNGQRLFNPTCRSLWLKNEGRVIELPGGSEITLA